MSIGSILQSYAISKVLSDLGYPNTIWLEEWNRTINRVRVHNFKGFLKLIYRIHQNKKFKLAHKKRLSFVYQHMDTRYFSNYEEFTEKSTESQDSIYLAGSDQIWNPDRCNPLFFLDFVTNRKRISYAASMGKTEIPPENEDAVGKMIRNFDRISVREKVCADVLQKFTDQEIAVHIDPTFLLDKKTWEFLQKPYKVKGPYILLYMLYWNKSCKKQIVALKKRTGLSVYAICPDISRVYADKHFYDVGVGEFLWLVNHAEYIITSSFHGVALSIIFQKKFSAVINPSSPSRIENLLNVLGAPCVSIDALDSTDAFVYDAIYANINKERQKSQEYLKDALL
jgi:hypothetical protein